MLGIVGGIAGTYAGYVALAYLLRKRFVFPMVGVDFRRWHLWPHRDGQTLRFETEVGEGFAHHLPAKDGKPRGRVILYHGNLMVAVDMAALAEKWSDMGFDVVVPEFRGYGGFPGVPTPRNIVSDTLKALDMLPDVDGPLIGHGISLGGGLVMEFCRQRNLDAVVLQSTFSSIGDAAWRYGLPGTTVSGYLNSKEVMNGYDGKVLIIHGDGDRLFGSGHPDRMAKAVPDENNLRRVTVTGGRHMISEGKIFKILGENIDWLSD